MADCRTALRMAKQVQWFLRTLRTRAVVPGKIRIIKEGQRQNEVSFSDQAFFIISG